MFYTEKGTTMKIGLTTLGLNPADMDGSDLGSSYLP